MASYFTSSVVFSRAEGELLGMVNGYVATDNILCNKLNIQP